MRVPRFRNTPALIIAVLALIVAVAGGGYAVAGGKIKGSEIAKKTIKGKNIHKKTIKTKHVSKKKPLKCKVLVDQACEANQGQQGEPGSQGPKGDQGQPGEYVGPNWNPIARNNIGSPLVNLMSGPYPSFGVTGPEAKPPYGIGSLYMGVSDDALSTTNTKEKATFGNGVDFLGDPPGGLTDVGFHVFQTGENAAISATNMPNISLEINPAVGGKTYTSMVWVPDAVPVPSENKWSGYIDATSTGFWYFTNGTVAAATGCGISDSCSLADAQAALVASNDGGTAAIFTVAVGKGRDNAWFGAVDGLRINAVAYDFEPFGVSEVAP